MKKRREEKQKNSAPKPAFIPLPSCHVYHVYLPPRRHSPPPPPPYPSLSPTCPSQPPRNPKPHPPPHPTLHHLPFPLPPRLNDTPSPHPCSPPKTDIRLVAAYGSRGGGGGSADSAGNAGSAVKAADAGRAAGELSAAAAAEGNSVPLRASARSGGGGGVDGASVVACVDCVCIARIACADGSTGTGCSALASARAACVCESESERAGPPGPLEMQEYRRLLYVGMTRAQDWLIVCGYRGAREPSDESWLRVVEQGFGTAKECKTPLRDENDKIVKGLMIETAGKKRAQAEPLSSEAFSPQPFDAALMKNVRSEPAAVAPVSPSRLADSDPTDPPPLPSEDENGSEIWSSADRGTLMHGLLERLAPLAVDRRAEIGARGLSEPADLAALDTVLEILDDDAFGWMFGAGSIAEAKIAGPVAALKGRPVSGYIDRLIVRDERVDIVDFKSGKPSADMPEAYLRQLALYQAVLREIYPKHEVRAHLLWIDVPRLDTASDVDLEAALKRAVADLRKREKPAVA